MLKSFARPAFVVGAALGALALAGCGDGGKAEKDGAAKVNPATPAADPARASKVNGLGPDGRPIDAVQAAEMKESQLPPLPASAEAPQETKAPTG